jgi:lysozyme family protein
MNGQGTLDADITVDGQCGAMTRAALQAFIQRRGSEGRAVLLETVKSFQAGHYLGLAEAIPSQETFIYGWIRSRILGLA